MKNGDLCMVQLGNKYDPQWVPATFIKEVQHPYLTFVKMYKVIDNTGKMWNMSEVFVKSV